MKRLSGKNFNRACVKCGQDVIRVRDDVVICKKCQFEKVRVYNRAYYEKNKAKWRDYVLKARGQLQ